MIRALLVDDETPARSELRFLLAEHADVQVVGEAGGAREALDLARELEPDVVFLDVEMPGLSGVEAAPLVRERTDPPAVVFVTAHERYAVDAFAVEAFDYLLKPVDPDRLARVVDRLREPVLSRLLDTLLTELRVEIVPVDLDQARTARGAYRDFGKGSGHPAGLNFGDCFSYALARETDEPLLFVGDDFGHTDVRLA